MLGIKKEKDYRQGGLMDLGLNTEEEGDDVPSLVMGALSLKHLELMSSESITSDCWDADDKAYPYNRLLFYKYDLRVSKGEEGVISLVKILLL
jgi:hypothetical protein